MRNGLQKLLTGTAIIGALAAQPVYAEMHPEKTYTLAEALTTQSGETVVKYEFIDYNKDQYKDLLVTTNIKRNNEYDRTQAYVFEGTEDGKYRLAKSK